jgi:SAM-dependent methyltransferase
MTKCIICNGATETIQNKEINVSCGDYFEGRRIFVDDVGETPLFACLDCGFAAFYEIHAWPRERFARDIYNGDYILCDPPFRIERPAKLAKWLASVLEPCVLIDYGGGEGATARLLRQSGFSAQSYDVFHDNSALPAALARVVTCFEVVEHVPAQSQLFGDMASLLADDGLLIFTTLIRPRGLTGDWWYASARNGHISFHTAESLERLVRRSGLSMISLSPEIHVASRRPEALDKTRRWPVIAINDTPGFRFARPWSELAPGSW